MPDQYDTHAGDPTKRIMLNILRTFVASGFLFFLKKNPPFSCEDEKNGGRDYLVDLGRARDIQHVLRRRSSHQGQGR